MDPLELLRARMAGRSLRALAREIGISAAYLSDVMNLKRNPGPAILAYLGLERIEGAVSYRKARRPREQPAA